MTETLSPLTRNTEEMMSLLNKIAISNGHKLRKAAANLIITTMDGKTIADWNRSLQDTIFEKKRLRAIPVTKGDNAPK
jgi:hypothetical protein